MGFAKMFRTQTFSCSKFSMTASNYFHQTPGFLVRVRDRQGDPRSSCMTPQPGRQQGPLVGR